MSDSCHPIGALRQEPEAAVHERAHRTIAALFVETDGAYFDLPGVDPWDEQRDARKYAGPHPVVAHPPSQRWGRFWHGSTRKPHQFKMGDDGGCFLRAFNAVCLLGGVIEHPADSHAWDRDHFWLTKPPRRGGWVQGFPDSRKGWRDDVWTCCVYQGNYGHLAGKPTWLFVAGLGRDQLPELRWGKVAQRLHPVALAKHGYAKARRIGMMAMVGGKDKTRTRNATPPEFRELLVELARSCQAASGSGLHARSDGSVHMPGVHMKTMTAADAESMGQALAGARSDDQDERAAQPKKDHP